MTSRPRTQTVTLTGADYEVAEDVPEIWYGAVCAAELQSVGFVSPLNSFFFFSFFFLLVLFFLFSFQFQLFD